MGDLFYTIGQMLGIVAIILGFISYQMSSQKKLLFLQVVTTVVFFLHYWMIGATSGMAMNIVNLFRNITYYYRSRTGKQGWLVPLLYAVILSAIGILTWEAWYSVFVFSGVIVHTIGMSLPNPQMVRKSILISSPLVLIYDIFVRSYGGIVYESVAVVSCLIGLFRHKTEEISQQ